MHDTILSTVCFYPWCIQCILAMLLPVDSFKVLRDVVLRDAWFTCYRSTLLILYLRYTPLIYVACSTCYQYIMILIQLSLHVTNIATNNYCSSRNRCMMIVCHESICTGNELEVVCQWLKVHTSPCYSRDLCSKYERDNSATNATNQPIICFIICLFRWSNMPKLSWPAQIDDLHLISIVDLSSISNTTIVGFLILPAYMQWQRL